MSGRKCERCWKEKIGYCPFDEACKHEVFERFNKVRKCVGLKDFWENKKKC